MASPPQVVVLILTAVFVSTAAAAAAATPTPKSPQDSNSISTILSTLGFQELSTAATAASLPNATPTTIFAPTDSSLLTCPSCSLPLLLQEHSLPSLYPLRHLSTFPFGTKIQTLAPNRCLTLTSSTTTTTFPTLFINGVEVTRPDLFTSRYVIVHGIQGFLSHLSPLSCHVELMTTLTFPPDQLATSAFFVMRLMLKDAMLRLRISGYSVLALAMRHKYRELLQPRALTVFALDDSAIFEAREHAYVPRVLFHIVPNRRLMAADLVGLTKNTVLPTMELGKMLVVTTAGGGGPLVSMRINYVKIKGFDLLYNDRIVIHVLSLPFHHPAKDGNLGQIGRSVEDFVGSDGMVVPMPTVMTDDYHGL
ncbi:hypothetical protein RJ639_038400 [Escallonia herrerae]|uniref:FAS1 domain-containing protein n=1 Tax=Escallonia herrerae TaxID=1293975 RepID=A0AA88WK29_9ASTE|nr:hypothetical protein RJ639_038400 [Escallonia herrerae]